MRYLSFSLLLFITTVTVYADVDSILSFLCKGTSEDESKTCVDTKIEKDYISHDAVNLATQLSTLAAPLTKKEIRKKCKNLKKEKIDDEMLPFAGGTTHLSCLCMIDKKQKKNKIQKNLCDDDGASLTYPKHKKIEAGIAGKLYQTILSELGDLKTESQIQGIKGEVCPNLKKGVICSNEDYKAISDLISTLGDYKYPPDVFSAEFNNTIKKRISPSDAIESLNKVKENDYRTPLLNITNKNLANHLSKYKNELSTKITNFKGSSSEFKENFKTIKSNYPHFQNLTALRNEINKYGNTKKYLTHLMNEYTPDNGKKKPSTDVITKDFCKVDDTHPSFINDIKATIMLNGSISYKLCQSDDEKSSKDALDLLDYISKGVDTGKSLNDLLNENFKKSKITNCIQIEKRINSMCENSRKDALYLAAKYKGAEIDDSFFNFFQNDQRKNLKDEFHGSFDFLSCISPSLTRGAKSLKENIDLASTYEKKILSSVPQTKEEKTLEIETKAITEVEEGVKAIKESIQSGDNSKSAKASREKITKHMNNILQTNVPTFGNWGTAITAAKNRTYKKFNKSIASKRKALKKEKDELKSQLKKLPPEERAKAEKRIAEIDKELEEISNSVERVNQDNYVDTNPESNKEYDLSNIKPEKNKEEGSEKEKDVLAKNTFPSQKQSSIKGTTTPSKSFYPSTGSGNNTSTSGTITKGTLSSASGPEKKDTTKTNDKNEKPTLKNNIVFADRFRIKDEQQNILKEYGDEPIWVIDEEAKVKTLYNVNTINGFKEYTFIEEKKISDAELKVIEELKGAHSTPEEKQDPSRAKELWRILDENIK